MFTIEVFSLLICIQSETPKRQKEKHVEKTSAYTGYRRLYLCDRFFEQKMAENEDKNTNRLENNGCYSSISLVSVIQILASTK